MATTSRQDLEVLKRAGGHALREMARQKTLLATLQDLETSKPQQSRSSDEVLLRIIDTRTGGVLGKIAQQTGQRPSDLARVVDEQLGVVASFATLDGTTLDVGIQAAQNLILSGRVELFTR